MASGIARSPFLTTLNKALGIRNPQSLRHRLNKAGYPAPYLDVYKALDIVEQEKEYATKAKAFRARLERDAKFCKAMTTPAPSALVTLKGAGPKAQAGDGNGLGRGHRDAKSEALRVKKFKATRAKKLMPRLAQHLMKSYKITEPAAKQRAVKILRSQDYYGPRWDDQARAVECFMRAGIDMTGFEFIAPEQTTTPGTAVVVANGKPLVTALTPSTPEPQTLQTSPFPAELVAERLTAAESARGSLEQFEHSLVQMIRYEGLNTIPYPLDRALNALNDIRPHKGGLNELVRIAGRPRK